MPLSVPPMLPEDRKYLDVPLMPEPGMSFRKDGCIWQLVKIQVEPRPRGDHRLTLEFIGVDSVDPVNPVLPHTTPQTRRINP